MKEKSIVRFLFLNALILFSFKIELAEASHLNSATAAGSFGHFAATSFDCYTEKEKALSKLNQQNTLRISCESEYDGTSLILGVNNKNELSGSVTLIKKDCSTQELDKSSFDLFELNELDFKLRSKLDALNQKRTILLVTAFTEDDYVSRGTLKINNHDEYLVSCLKITAN